MTENSAKKNWHSTEELATFHDNIGIFVTVNESA